MNFILKKIASFLLDIEQRQVNKLYESQGLTDLVLEKQVFINESRNELDLPDRKEFLFERFVQ